MWCKLLLRLIHIRSGSCLESTIVTTQKALFYPIDLQTKGAMQNVLPHPRPEVDLVAIAINNQLEGGYFRHVRRSMIASPEFHERYGVAEGTGTFTVGYLLGYQGKIETIRSFLVADFLCSQLRSGSCQKGIGTV